MISIEAKRRCTAEVFAFAALTLFPGTKLVGVHSLDYGFAYDFVFPFEKIDPQMVEDRLFQVRIENIPIYSKVMMRENAAQFFRYHSQEYLAELALKQAENLLYLIQIEETFLLCKEPHFKTTKEVIYFKTLSVKELENSITRIEVAAFETKDELKQFLKKYIQVGKLDPREAGKELGLLHSDGLMPAGVKLRGVLFDFLRKAYFKEGFSEVYSSKEPWTLMEDAKLTKAVIFYENQDMAYLNECFSPLQFIEKIIKLLGLEVTADLVDSRRQFYFKDALGRKSDGAFFEKREDGKIKFSIFGRFDCLITALIEKYSGGFPFWMAPEQVRILPLTPNALDEAKKVKEKLESNRFRVIIDEGVGGLKNKISDAQARKIPVLCVIGDREVQNHCLSVRTSQDVIDMSEIEFIAHLLDKIRGDERVYFESQ